METLVAILAARGELDETRRDSILTERDVARIERWIDLALAGASIGEIFTR